MEIEVGAEQGCTWKESAYRHSKAHHRLASNPAAKPVDDSILK